MKKMVLCAVLLVAIVLFATGCNRQIIDLNFKYDRAILALPNGDVIEGSVQSWRDYDEDEDDESNITWMCKGVIDAVHK